MSENLFQPAPDTAPPAPAVPDAAEVAEWPTQTLAEGLVALQGRLPRIGKGQTADVKSNSGASYSYQYADLSDVSRALLPVMSSVGLAFTARPTLIDGTLLLAYALVHVSGEREEGVYPLPSGGNPQAIGSAITYARRYCLLAVAGLHPDGEDDDAAAAMPRGGRGQSTPPAPPVDAEWVAEARRRTATATTRDQLRTVWDVIGQAAESGRVDQATAERLRAEVNGRVAEVDAASAQAAAEEPAPPAAAPVPFAGATPGTVPDPGPSPWDEPPRPRPTPPAPAPEPAPVPSVVPPAQDREQQLADMRARARRIADNHTTTTTVTGDDQ